MTHPHRISISGVLPGLLLFLAAAGAASLRADTIILTDGRVFTGMIQEETGDEVKLKMKLGLRSFKKSEIKTITREAIDESPDFLKELDKAVSLAESGKPLSALADMKKIKDKYTDVPILKNVDKLGEEIARILANHPRLAVQDNPRTFADLIEQVTRLTEGLCKRCEGSATQVCTLCKGKGNKPCSLCKNQRKIPCGGCEGTGRDTSVGGKFETPCPDCSESSAPDGKKRKGFRWTTREEYNPGDGTTKMVESWAKCERCLGRGVVAIREGVHQPYDPTKVKTPGDTQKDPAPRADDPGDMGGSGKSGG